MVGALILLAFFVSKSCQQSQIRITQEEAIAIAKREVDFRPKSTQIRLLRQGLNRKPFWFVSLSNPIGSAVNPEGFSRLAIVEVDANSGKVESVKQQAPAQGAASRIEVSQGDAVSTAEDQIDFIPRQTRVRLLRQGSDRTPLWAVTFADAAGKETVVTVNANSGDVEDVTQP